MGTHTGRRTIPIKIPSCSEVITREPLKVIEDEQALKLRQDTNCVSDFKREKLKRDAKKNWDLFYKRNSTNFFKDRHWTTREFLELKRLLTGHSSSKTVLLEVGCGVGNALFPLVEELSDNDNYFFYACDFSSRAVDFVKANPLYCNDRMEVFVCDLTVDDLRSSIVDRHVDLCSMLFVLSAIYPDKMARALKNIFEVLKPGGIVLFRDYGLHDYAQLRFSNGHKISENFYVRQDGTCAYYFGVVELKELFEAAGFTTLDCEYVHRETVNVKEQLRAARVFVQAKFQKTDQVASTDVV